MGSKIEEKVLFMLDVLSACVQDYDQLIDYSEDPELIRTIVLYIEKTLKI